ncbi:hypothetical protein BDM02DRAFT_3261720 [Thelephora ganbajun]|uniref:Uncharacterized protein n=1 Tax=Thelephora ganbajun TaxID=370292 RepID=A0ACB6ZCT8_THEGA|nr:hypothetical protein BDM02DRAFT_3261720 [Thelephora ganbajun]
MSKFLKIPSRSPQILPFSLFLWILTWILRSTSPKQSTTHARRSENDNKSAPKAHYWSNVNPPQIWNGGQVMEISSTPLIDRRRDAIFQSEREFGEYETTSAKMSHNGRTPTAKTPLFEEAAKHKSIAPEIHVLDDDLDGPYNFQVIPPTPNGLEATTLEKQDAPEEQPHPHVENDEIAKDDDVCRLDEAKGQVRLRVVETGTGREIRYDPPPYPIMKYGRNQTQTLGFR